MPIYAKFIKENLTKKIRYTNEKTIRLKTSYNTYIQQTLPQKENDLRRVTLPVNIGNVNIGKSLIDLGENTNLILLSIIRRISDLETKMTLQLVDKIIKSPFGIDEDVLVLVDKFLLTFDFLVMDVKDDDKVPLILG